MKIKVEQCWGGKDLYYRITMPDGARERIDSDRWTRRVASEALDLLERVYGLDRSTVRFKHH